jgi:hypothetical protein
MARPDHLPSLILTNAPILPILPVLKTSASFPWLRPVHGEEGRSL